MWALQYIHDNLSNCTQSCTNQWESTKKVHVKNDLERRLYGGQGQNQIGCAHLSCWYCIIICWKGIVLAGPLRKVVPISEDQWKNIQVKHDLRMRSKQNKRCIFTLCWHCNACMIICWKGMAFAWHCTQNGTHQWGSTNKIQVKHDLGRRLYGGQGQKYKVVPISEDQWIKSKLNTTSGGGYMEVKVKTK